MGFLVKLNIFKTYHLKENSHKSTRKRKQNHFTPNNLFYYDI